MLIFAWARASAPRGTSCVCSTIPPGWMLRQPQHVQWYRSRIRPTWSVTFQGTASHGCALPPRFSFQSFDEYVAGYGTKVTITNRPFLRRGGVDTNYVPLDVRSWPRWRFNWTTEGKSGQPRHVASFERQDEILQGEIPRDVPVHDCWLRGEIERVCHCCVFLLTGDRPSTPDVHAPGNVQPKDRTASNNANQHWPRRTLKTAVSLAHTTSSTKHGNVDHVSSSI